MSRSSNATRHETAADSTAAFDAFMLGLEHPHKRAIEAIRRAILGAAPGVRFDDLQDFDARRDAFVDLIRAWAAQV